MVLGITPNTKFVYSLTPQIKNCGVFFPQIIFYSD